MIPLILFISIVLLAIHMALAPRKYLVHAARAEKFPQGRRVNYKYACPKLFFDEDGKRIPRKRQFIGEAIGDSMEAHGIRAGAEFFGTKIDDVSDLEKKIQMLRPDCIVVIDDVANFSKTGLRLRRLKKIGDDGMLEFFSHQDGRAHKNRHVSKVFAVVTHVAV